MGNVVLDSIISELGPTKNIRTEDEAFKSCLFYDIIILWCYKIVNFMQHNYVFYD